MIPNRTLAQPLPAPSGRPPHAAGSYLALKADAAAGGKLSAMEAHAAVVSTPEGRAAYERHLAAKGVIKL